MKDRFYFSHDYHSRDDEKISRLIMKGWQYYGLYWALVEMLHENDGWCDYDCERIAFVMRTDCDTIKYIISESDLFIVDKEAQKFSSARVQENLKHRKEKSKKAKISAENRWRKEGCERNADAMRTLNTPDANAMLIKERKGKERKVNNITQGSSKDSPVIYYEEPQKNSTPKHKSNNSARPMMDWYCSEFERLKGIKACPSWAQDMKHLKDMLSVYGEDVLRSAITKYLESDDDWIAKNGYTIGILYKKIQSFVIKKETKTAWKPVKPLEIV